MIDKTTLMRVVPKKYQDAVDDNLVDMINNTFNDPEMREMYRDNILGYAHVMQEGKFKITQYLDAVRYVGFRVMGNNKTSSYIKTFPDRYRTKKANGVPDKDIASLITSYSKNKLVNLIYKQSMIHTSILNADVFQEAINTQAAIMRDDDASFKVRSDAANSLMTHLKAPEEAKMELDITVKESEAMAELREATVALAKQQYRMSEEKIINANDIAKQNIFRKP